MSSVRIKTEICQYVHAPVIVPPDAQRCDFWGSEDEFEVIIMKELGSKKGYIRDGRAPVPKSEVTSRIMSRIRGKDTKPELELRKALRKIGLSGYRLHWKKSPGRPDIAYPGKRWLSSYMDVSGIDALIVTLLIQNLILTSGRKSSIKILKETSKNKKPLKI